MVQICTSTHAWSHTADFPAVRDAWSRFKCYQDWPYVSVEILDTLGAARLQRGVGGLLDNNKITTRQHPAIVNN